MFVDPARMLPRTSLWLPTGLLTLILTFILVLTLTFDDASTVDSRKHEILKSTKQFSIIT